MTTQPLFVRNGAAIRVSTHTQVMRDLPPANYKLSLDQMGLYLEEMEALKGEQRLYGDVQARAERILHTFQSRDKSTGVILSGTKGSGKTLLARVLSQELLDLGIPTITIGFAVDGDDLSVMLGAITTPVMLIFDEFEKIYGRNEGEAQKGLLTLFDGLNSSNKRLTVVTTNNSYGISEFMRSRPGRFFYHYRYEGLEEAFIREYSAEKLDDATDANINGVVAISKTIYDFTFDILKALIEEMNRYREPAREAVRHLNVEFESSTAREYKVTSFTIKSGKGNYVTVGGAIRPLLSAFNVAVSTANAKVKAKLAAAVADYGLADETEAFGFIDERVSMRHVVIKPEHLVSMADGALTFETPELRFTMETVRSKAVHAYDYL